MGESGNKNAASLQTAMNAVHALGRGFDVNFDTRLLYCKGVTGSRIVEIDDEHGRYIYLDNQTVLPNISRDIKNSSEPFGRHSSGGSATSMSFNSAFSFTGSTNIDASMTKTVAMDGFYIPVARFQLTKTPSALQENVKQAVPTSWEPSALARCDICQTTSYITFVYYGDEKLCPIYWKPEILRQRKSYKFRIMAYSTVKGYTLSLPPCHILMGKRY
ncbi:hypothetical protein V6N11_054920 [Hibiscus sabdariffa]|uniref:MACPF domain-containing protein n=1 Tax=Hibiscus sabdariffa TaxID=183260 RepID=A0ABR2P442_9ROSI